MNRCPKCRVYLADLELCELCCTHQHCLRPVYAEGLCKLHRDEHRYARMRELERCCRPQVRVRCLTTDSEFIEGIALSEVRLLWKPIPTRDRWPSVLVQLEGHLDALEWPAIDVEVA